MDINIRIIEQVKKYPQLYEKNSNTLKRLKLWNTLASAMKIDAQFLKNRWYILRERYIKTLQNFDQPESRNSFKYTKEMNFIKEHISPQTISNGRPNKDLPPNWIKPEFIITEADLKWKPESGQETGAIFFISAEEGKQQHSEKQKSGVEEIVQAVVIEKKEIPYDQVKKQAQKDEQVTAPQKSELQNNTQELNPVKKPKEIVVALVHQEPEIMEKVTIKQEAVDEAKAPPVETNSTGNSGKRLEKLAENISNEKKEEKTICTMELTVNERCEDSIFGELVAAMLKTMEPTKKKAMKKEIMNMLLS